MTQDALDAWVYDGGDGGDGGDEEEEEDRMGKAEDLRAQAFERAHLSFCEMCLKHFHQERGISVRWLDEKIADPDGRDVYSVCSLCEHRPGVDI